MDLETFICETLRQIVKGVKTAQLHEDCKGADINPEYTTGPEVKQIDFDVALTVTEGTEKLGKGNIGVASVLGIGGQASLTSASSSVSRIKFNIPLVLPTNKLSG
jgi:malic enzyme